MPTSKGFCKINTLLRHDKIKEDNFGRYLNRFFWYILFCILLFRQADLVYHNIFFLISRLIKPRKYNYVPLQENCHLGPFCENISLQVTV